MSDAPILEVETLSPPLPGAQHARVDDGRGARARRRLVRRCGAGETLGIVGESGCGKSTLGKALVGIHPPSGGRIVFEGKDVTGQSAAERRAVAPKLQYCYQDPGNSLDPRWTIRRSLAEPLVVHTALLAAERDRAHRPDPAAGRPAANASRSVSA